MVLCERALQSGELAAGRRQALHRQHAMTVGLHREHEARAHWLAVELHGARAADTVLAANVRASQSHLMADEVRQQRPRLDLTLVIAAVDLEPDSHGSAATIARRTSSATNARR